MTVRAGHSTDVTLRVGIIGTGWVARERHLPSFEKARGAAVTAVLDPRPDRARAFADRVRTARWFTEPEAFFASGLDAVSICTPPWTHAELAVTALRAGLHVLCEKPFALSSTDAREVVSAAVSTGRVLTVAHNLLYSRAVRASDRVVAGRVRLAIGLQLSSPRRRLPSWYARLPGGLFADESPHMLYLLAHALGCLTLDDVRGTLDSSGTPAWVDVGFRGERAPGRLTMSFDSPVSEWHLGLVAPDAVVDVDLFRDVIVRTGPDGAHRRLDILASSAAVLAGHAGGVIRSGVRYATGRLMWGHDELVARFVDAALGRAANPVDVAQALAVVDLSVQILDALGVRSA